MLLNQALVISKLCLLSKGAVIFEVCNQCNYRQIKQLVTDLNWCSVPFHFFGNGGGALSIGKKAREILEFGKNRA